MYGFAGKPNTDQMESPSKALQGCVIDLEERTSTEVFQDETALLKKIVHLGII